MIKKAPFKSFKTNFKIVRLSVMLYVRFPLSLRNVEDLLHERGIDVSHETVRYWWHRFGPVFAAEIRKRRIQGLRSSRWCGHLDEMFVKINGEMHGLWRAVDHEGEVLESYVPKTRDNQAAQKIVADHASVSTAFNQDEISPKDLISRPTVPPLSSNGAASALNEGRRRCPARNSFEVV